MVPIKVLKDESGDSDKEYDFDYICSSQRISYFKKVKNGDPAVSIHRGKCKFPTSIAYRTHTRLKQTDPPILIGRNCILTLTTVPHGPEYVVLYCGIKYHYHCSPTLLFTVTSFPPCP